MPWYHGWNVVAAGLIFQAISFGIGIYCFTFYVSPWAEEFGVGRGEIMVIFFILTAAMGLMAPLAGRAMDRLPIRLLVIAGALSLAVALLLAARASALWQLMLIYGTLIVGGTSLSGPLAAQTLTARWFNRRRGLALGISTVGTSMGGLILPPVVTALQASMGWRDANDVLALIVVLAVIPLAWFTIRNVPTAEEAAVEATSDSGGPITHTRADENRVWRVAEVFREPMFWLMVTAFALFGLINGGLQQNLAPYGQDQGFDAQATAWAISVMALLMAIWKVVIGALTDRIEVRWIFVFSASVLLSAMWWMSRSISYVEFALICAMLGIATAAHLPLLAAIVSRRFGVASFGLVMGLIGPFTALSAAGPWIAGKIRDTSGSYDGALMVFAVLLVPALMAMLVLRLKPRSSG
ncbi:MAG: MFS transporter [Gammaproteobacteria bacterium]|nr:MFS transporter [Gammaproteobacteria bacterium]